MAKANDKTSWYLEPYVWLLVLFPATAVIAGFYTLYLAVVSDDGLVTDDYYKEGLAINQTLERDQAAKNHGLQGYLRFNEETGLVQMQLSAAAGYAPPEKLRLALNHATRAGFDQIVVLERIDSQTYQGQLPALKAPGQWRLQVEADDWRLLGAAKMPGTTQLALAPSS